MEVLWSANIIYIQSVSHTYIRDDLKQAFLRSYTATASVTVNKQTSVYTMQGR